MTILITGATGFLGGHLATRLAEAGTTVRALVRKTSNTRALEALGAELVVGDVESGEGLVDAVDGADAVVHAAGGGKVLREADFERQNLGSTTRLLEAIDQAPKKPAHFVLISSLAAAGPATKDRPRTPDDEPRPASLYGKAKRDAEEAVLARDDLRSTIIRPPAIYGPGDTRFVPLFQAIRKHLLPLPPGRAMSVVYGPDCAEAIHLALTKQPESGSVFFTDDGVHHTWRDMGRHIAAALDTWALPYPVPSAALFLGGVASELYSKVSGRPVVLTRDKWRDGRQAYMLCDSSSTREALGWSPRTAFEDGARTTARWYLDEGWL